MLGFYAGVLAIIEVGCIAAIAVLASTDSLRYLVPYVLAFAAFLVVVLIGIVVAINLIDPTKLQLSPVTGSEFIEYQRMTLGDSKSGDTVEARPIRGEIAAADIVKEDRSEE